MSVNQNTDTLVKQNADTLVAAYRAAITEQERQESFARLRALCPKDNAEGQAARRHIILLSREGDTRAKETIRGVCAKLNFM